MWQLVLLPATDQKIVKFDMGYQTAKLPDLWWDAINAYCFATLKINNGFNRLFEGMELIKLLFEIKFRKVMDCSVMHGAFSAEEALEVL